MSKYFQKKTRSDWISHLFSKETDENLRVLKEIRDNTDASDADRIKAIGMMLDRAHGKPHQSVAIESDEPDLVVLTDERVTEIMLEAFGDAGALPPHKVDGDGESEAS